MKNKPVLIAIAALAAGAIAGGAWWWRQTAERAAIVSAALPPPPDLSSANAILRERLAAAEAAARTFTSARDGLVELSRLYHANGFLDEAVQCYRTLEQIDPREARWPHLHATIIAGYGEIEPAIALWRKAVELAPDYTPARLRLGDSLLKANRFAEATAAYEAVLRQKPDDPYAQLGLARLDLEAGRDEAARVKLEALVKQTNYQLGYDLIVSLYERLGDRERAAAIRGALQTSGAYRDPPDPWLDGLIDACYDPFRLGMTAGLLGRSGDNAAAQRLLERAIELEPGDVSSHFQLGMFALQQKNIPLARAQLERCTELAPEFADGWAHLSALHAQLGDQATADRILAAGLKRCPDSPGLHLMLGRNLAANGQTDQAIREFNTSIRLRPNEPDAYIELGNLLISLGREADGVARIRQASEADPGNPMALSVLAFYTIQTGDEAAARGWLARVQDQPRIPRDQAAKLIASYEEKFGHPWRR